MKELKWRSEELALIKKSTVMQDSTPEMRAVMRRYAVPAFYSLWEGFVYFIFNKYIDIINKSRKKIIKVNSNIVRHVMCGMYELRQDTKDKDKQKLTLAHISRSFRMPIVVPDIVPTASNVDYAQLKKILSAYGLDWPGVSIYEGTMGEFMNFRHGVAHGNMAVRDVDTDRLSRFATLIDDLMNDLLTRVDAGVQNKDYLKDPFGDLVGSL